MRKAKMISKKLEAAKTMPPVYHKIPNGDFELSESELIEWLATQSEMLDWLKDRLKDNGFIIYNSETGKWQGVDYND